MMNRLGIQHLWLRNCYLRYPRAVPRHDDFSLLACPVVASHNSRGIRQPRSLGTPSSINAAWRNKDVNFHHFHPSRLRCSTPLSVSRSAPTPQKLPPAEGEVCCVRCTLLDVTGQQAEELSDYLLGEGATSASVEEFRPPGGVEQEIYDDGAGRKLWDRCTVVALFPLEHDVPSSIGAVEQYTGLSLQYITDDVIAREWVEAVKSSYQPLEVCSGMWIIPTWHQPPRPQEINIMLEPGLAFGTGEHPTTRLCLQWLRGLPLKGCSVMDYGTGSGVLAIAALLLGATHAIGVDVDPLACKATLRNATQNGVQDKLTAVPCGPSISDPEPLAAAGIESRVFDICVANILRGPLLELQPRLSLYVRQGGRIALSGILAEQAPLVMSSYSAEFDDLSMQEDGHWALVTGIKK